MFIRTRTTVCSGILVAALSLVAASPASANEEVYRKAVGGTALVLRADGGHGTGWLVDAEKGLMITARHVIVKGDGVLDTVKIIFAQFKDGEVINDRKFYDQNEAKLAINAKIIHHDVRRDLAVLKLDRVPAGMSALKLASKSPRPGADVHVIGNSTRKHGGMFGYCQGKVRNVFVWDPAGDPILARVVAHHTPTNKGDSGGPVLNNAGEVVAFISQGTIGLPAPRESDFYAVQVTDHSIAVEEIRTALTQMSGPLAAR
jgi:S1-C subfamily serine protease